MGLKPFERLLRPANGLRLSLACLSVFAFTAWMTACAPPKKAEDPVKRGEHLVTVGGCDDCHTPKVQGPNGEPAPDMSRRLSGHPADAPYPTWNPADMARNALALTDPNLTAWAGPWGVSFSANLTPDKSGLSEWTEEAFIQALRTGKHQGQANGRPILPPMPWQNYSKLTDDELKAVWAYLKTLTPVVNAVPTPIPPAGAPAEGGGQP